MKTREASQTENDPSSYKINLGEGELCALDKKLLYLLLSKKELERKNKETADTKIKIQHSDYDDYIPREFTYLNTFEPETTYHPIFRNNKLYFIIQFHQGITLLQALLENRIQHPILLLKNLTTQLQSLHNKGLVHLDLKPDNIIINPTTHAVMIIDLGYAREIACMIGPTGNHFFMTPERMDGFIRADAEQDIYSFGILAYQILANDVSAIPPILAHN